MSEGRSRGLWLPRPGRFIPYQDHMGRNQTRFRTLTAGFVCRSPCPSDQCNDLRPQAASCPIRNKTAFGSRPLTLMPASCLFSYILFPIYFILIFSDTLWHMKPVYPALCGFGYMLCRWVSPGSPAIAHASSLFWRHGRPFVHACFAFSGESAVSSQSLLWII